MRMLRSHNHSNADRVSPLTTNRYMIDPSGTSWGYYGCAQGKGKQNARSEIEKLKMSEMTCEELVKEAARIMCVHCPRRAPRRSWPVTRSPFIIRSVCATALCLCCFVVATICLLSSDKRVCVCVCARAHTHTHTHTHTRTHHSHAKVSLTRSLARAHACTPRHSYAVHDEAKEKDFHLFMSWVGAPTGGRHEMVPEAIFNEAERLAKAALEDDDDDDDDDDKDGMAE